MNARMKKRLAVVSGVIVMVLVVVLAVVGSTTAAKTTTVAEAVENPAVGQKVQVSGNVAANSFSVSDGVLAFKIYDPDASPTTQLEVRYEGAASSTFGNDVTAICTGKIGEDGVLTCSELVTKCPSKYESAEGALTVERLLEYGDAVTDKVVKVAGVVREGTLASAGQDVRFVLADAQDAVAEAGAGASTDTSVNAGESAHAGSSTGAGADASEIAVSFDGALPDALREGDSVVLTGSVNSAGVFVATDVAMEG